APGDVRGEARRGRDPARAARAERLRVRAPDGADEPPPQPGARHGLPGVGPLRLLRLLLAREGGDVPRWGRERACAYPRRGRVAKAAAGGRRRAHAVKLAPRVAAQAQSATVAMSARAQRMQAE